jgi:hypothetical protein
MRNKARQDINEEWEQIRRGDIREGRRRVRRGVMMSLAECINDNNVSNREVTRIIMTTIITSIEMNATLLIIIASWKHNNVKSLGVEFFKTSAYLVAVCVLDVV